jgi:hypothetical protein
MIEDVVDNLAWRRDAAGLTGRYLHESPLRDTHADGRRLGAHARLSAAVK